MGAEVGRHQADTATPVGQPARRQRMAAPICGQTVLRRLSDFRTHLAVHLVRQAPRLQLRSAPVQQGIVVHRQQAKRTEGLPSYAVALPGQCRQQALAVGCRLLPVAGPGGIVGGIHRSAKVGRINDRHRAKTFGCLGKLPQCCQRKAQLQVGLVVTRLQCQHLQEHPCGVLMPAQRRQHRAMQQAVLGVACGVRTQRVQQHQRLRMALLAAQQLDRQVTADPAPGIQCKRTLGTGQRGLLLVQPTLHIGQVQPVQRHLG